MPMANAWCSARHVGGVNAACASWSERVKALCAPQNGKPYAICPRHGRCKSETRHATMKAGMACGMLYRGSGDSEGVGRLRASRHEAVC